MIRSDFPRPEYDKETVRRAGNVLRGPVLWSEDQSAEIREIFAIANNWREAHAYPMRRFRFELFGQMRQLKQEAPAPVARLKRMRSIRKKLRTTPLHLDQIQDLAGCRAILASIEDVRLLVTACRDNLPHEVRRETDYINKPKQSGYRSHHILFNYRPREHLEIEKAFEGQRVEIQVRTRLQHSWATAVEAVGLVKSEDMKGGLGDARWLRLFQLMASEFAIAEHCPELPGAPSRKERVAEIKDLDASLNAVGMLENLSQAFRYLDTYYTPENPKYFLLKYDNTNGTVEVLGYDDVLRGTMSFEQAENDESVNSVLVEADKIESLKDAYPNYFGDVQLFKRNLSDVTRGKDAKEYTMPPQQTVRPVARETPDLSWFKRRMRWR
jgi:Region found in RelA / SpoT proteins